jgi:hypothetical protein
MKLTKEEIKFIDSYLIKNKVKFWDVRLELLDHIVSAVEDKIIKDGVSFNEALLEVHRGFGNQFIEFGTQKNKIFEKGLYQSNIGFQKFTNKKQKELARKYRKTTWRHIIVKLTSIKFLLEYIAFVLVFLSIYKYYPKSSFILGLLVLMIPTIYSSYYSIKDKSTRKSLNFSMTLTSGMLLWSMYNLSFYILKDFYGDMANMPYILFVVATCLLYPLMRTQIKVNKEVYIETKNTYNLKFL